MVYIYLLLQKKIWHKSISKWAVTNSGIHTPNYINMNGTYDTLVSARLVLNKAKQDFFHSQLGFPKVHLYDYSEPLLSRVYKITTVVCINRNINRNAVSF